MIYYFNFLDLIMLLNQENLFIIPFFKDFNILFFSTYFPF